MTDISRLTLIEVRDMIACGKLSSERVTNTILTKIQENKALNAYITVLNDTALEKAREVDRRIASGQKVGALAGVPIAVKDNIRVRGVMTTCGSRLLANNIADYDAAVVERLKEEDAVIIGKTNMDEFAMGSSNMTSGYGGVLNPWDKDRVPGGSSGGSVAAVAAGLAYGALGSDTGGSIRQPAAYCGVVGLKPTYSVVSKFGVYALASSLDQVGPIARNVEDCALLYSVISGHDDRDPTSDAQENIPCGTISEISHPTIGIVEQFEENLSDDVRIDYLRAIEIFRSMGAKIVKVSIPSVKAAFATYCVLGGAETAFNLNDIGTVQDRSKCLGLEAKKRILIGEYVMRGDNYRRLYLKAARVRTLIAKQTIAAVEGVDAILSPTAPSEAFRIDGDMKAYEVYYSDIFTQPASIAGLPSISIPSGTGRNGLPLGIQLIGKRGGENTIFSLGHAFEQVNSRGK